MTHGDLAAYWGAVAQIVPVLALTFVIEARLLVRRFSKKDQVRRRKARWAWAVAFLVLSVALAYTQLAALRALSQDTDSLLTKENYLDRSIANLTITVMLVVLVSVPVGQLTGASLVDLAAWVYTHTPWSRPQRLRRTYLEQMRLAEDQRRALREERFKALLRRTDSLLREDLGELEKQQLREAYAPVIASGVRGWESLRQAAEASTADPHFVYNLLDAVLDTFDGQIDEVEEVEFKAARDLEDLDELIAVRSPEALHALRGLLRGAVDR